MVIQWYGESDDSDNSGCVRDSGGVSDSVRGSDKSGGDRDSGGQALVRDRHQRPQFIGHRRFLPFLQLRQ